ncbi:hypothetical protein E2C01_043344 [Portunus trituberculatus]|uniref:Uncharacterized protein n=1 Tax=Portunus trituberculatus TaxID=210409 RepID=A0A5B7FP84_PORTR|nr:hypothetical protein [Portunus trituberculatus]
MSGAVDSSGQYSLVQNGYCRTVNYTGGAQLEGGPKDITREALHALVSPRRVQTFKRQVFSVG